MERAMLSLHPSTQAYVHTETHIRMHIQQTHQASPPTNLVNQSADHFSFKDIPERNPIKEAKQSLQEHMHKHNLKHAHPPPHTHTRQPSSDMQQGCRRREVGRRKDRVEREEGK